VRDFGSSGASSSGTGGGGGAGGGSSSSAGGGASCGVNESDCDNDGVCENLLDDVDHCGSCGNSCNVPGGGSGTCVGGMCDYACEMGFADCDQDPVTACVDLNMDGANCGACGHDCQGGACNAGVCGPVTLVPPGFMQSPYALAVDDKSLYIGTLVGELYTIPLTGGSPSMFGKQGGSIRSMAVTKLGVYITTGNRVTLFDFNGQSKWNSNADSNTNHLAVSDTAVVWTTTSRVRRADPNGTNQMDISTFSEPDPLGIVADLQFARWASSGAGEIREGKLDSILPGMFNVIFSGLQNPTLLVQDGAMLYGVDSKGIYRADMSTKKLDVLYPLGGGVVVSGLVAEEMALYWTEGNAAGTVFRGPKDKLGALPVAVAKDQPGPRGLAVGPTAVYWANELDGTIMKIAR